ncbi:ATP-grasp fold amidoligase family protein [Oceanobacillus jeddahense]|uniref:Teichuronopeptide biosynthesis n=1 Tax=Oceanobacillus jeddahense TaxID=1462527 RepID=A0ABY5JQN0_9BACI|nr:ATP-grasp fold amidoligase family protein [Oceanobacillus jeddahense]UUI02564.1 teichuronopeptide biosynthesis [Oceanobacillus jeddahense]
MPENKSYEEMIDQLIEKEAQLDETKARIAQTDKQIKKIMQSNTYQKTASVRKLLPSGKEKDNYIAYLEEQLLHYQSETVLLKEQLFEAEKALEQFDYDTLWRHIKAKKDKGKIIAELDKRIEQKKATDQNFRNLLEAAARQFQQEETAFKERIFTKVLAGAKSNASEFMARAGLTEDAVSLADVASYRACMNMRVRQYQLLGTLPEYELDDKQRAYRFMEKQAIRTPHSPEDIYTVETLPEKENIVIKPADGAGGRGVYIVYASSDIISVKTGEKLTNWSLLKHRMEKDLAENKVAQDAWRIEELVLEDTINKVSGRDVKFYCFYGKVGVILEIIRTPEIKYCWWNGQGERIQTGKYDDKSFQGQGVSKEEIEMAERISSMIPSPFMRIDFLRAEDGLVFGEFTPKPGNYDEFNDKIDTYLGNLFIEAQGKLDKDLLQGKAFEIFKEELK